MTSHDILSNDDRERAALYALGALESDAALLYAGHLAACAACRAEVDAHRYAVAALGRAVDPVAPPPSLKARVLGAVRPEQDAAAIQTWKRWEPSTAEGMTIVRDGSDWQKTGVAGVEVRCLYLDKANDRVTMLVRMAAGTSYPAHRHGGIEECYVLEGDLYGPDFEMRRGDYQRLDGGTVHGVQGTHDGCLLLIASSMHDELLPIHQA